MCITVYTKARTLSHPSRRELFSERRLKSIPRPQWGWTRRRRGSVRSERIHRPRADRSIAAKFIQRVIPFIRFSLKGCSSRKKSDPIEFQQRFTLSLSLVNSSAYAYRSRCVLRLTEIDVCP